MPRPRATILQVGSVERWRGEMLLRDWTFDCRGLVPILEHVNGVAYFAGYTIQELREIQLHANRIEELLKQ